MDVVLALSGSGAFATFFTAVTMPNGWIATNLDDDG
jgi:hypothetical protein